MGSLIVSIIGIVIGAIMQGIGIWQASAANQQNIELAEQNREDMQAFSTQAAKQANQATEHRYWNLYSPSATVNQLRAAGLSPGLFYGQGGSSGSNQPASMATTPSSMPATVNPIIPGDIFATMQKGTEEYNETRKTTSEIKVNETSVIKAEHEIEEIDATIKNIEAKTGTEFVTQRNIEADTKIKELDAKLKDATMDDAIGIMKQQRDIMRASYQETLEKIKGLEIDNENKQALYDAQIKKYNAEVCKLYAEARNHVVDSELKEVQKALAAAQTVKTTQEYRKMVKETEKLEREITKADKELEYIEKRGYGIATQGIGGKIAEVGMETGDAMYKGFSSFWDTLNEWGKEWQSFTATGGAGYF